MPSISHQPSSTLRKASKDEVTELRKVEQPEILKFRGYCPICVDHRQKRGSLCMKRCEARAKNTPDLHQNMCPQPVKHAATAQQLVSSFSVELKEM